MLASMLSACCGYVGSAASSSSVPPDWVKVRADTVFSIMAPPGTTFHPGKGKDASAGSFEVPGFNLSYDYSYYSNPLLNDAGDRNYEKRDIVIDGRKAKVVTSYSPRLSAGRPYFIGVHFSEVAKSAAGTVKLTVHTSVAQEVDYAVVEKIFESVRFE